LVALGPQPQPQGLDSFEGYYGDQAATDAVMTEDGYYRTGDIGEWTNGKGSNIRIVDRKSNIVKLSNGKFCSLDETQERVLSAHPTIEQVSGLQV
jgi:long-chain acyl-CoA synthetase